MHPHQPCLSSPDLNASISTLSTTCVHFLSSDTILRDRPTTITTTAAASDAVNDEQPPADDEQPLAHSTLSMSDASNPNSLSLFLEGWNTFYNEFVQSMTYHLAKLMAAPSKRDIVNAANDNLDPTRAFSSKLNELCHELTQLTHSSSAYPPHNSAYQHAPTTKKCDHDDRNNDEQAKTGGLV